MKLRKIIFIVSVLFLFTSCMEDIQKMLAPSATLPTDLKISITNNTSSERNLTLRILYPSRDAISYTINVGSNTSKDFELNLQTVYNIYHTDYPNSASFSLNLEVLDSDGALTKTGYNALNLSEKTYLLDKNAITISGTDIAWSSN